MGYDELLPSLAFTFSSRPYSLAAERRCVVVDLPAHGATSLVASHGDSGDGTSHLSMAGTIA